MGFLRYNPRWLMRAMNIEDGIDNWTEDDFKPSQINVAPVYDPWAVDTRSSASNGAKSLLGDPEDNALSKEAAPSKPGIYVPTVDRIRPYEPSSSRQSNRNGTESTAEAKNNRSIPVAAPLVQNSQSTSDLNLNDSEGDKPESANSNSTQPKISHAQDQLHLPLSTDLGPARRELSSDRVSQEEADLLVDAALKGVSSDDSLEDIHDDPLESEESDLLFSDDWFDSYSPSEADDQVAFAGYEEPEPNAEYDHRLHETLHQATQLKADLRRNLEIDEWLSKISYLDDAVAQEIREILMGFSVQRYNSWISWMRHKQWDAFLLVQFCRIWSDFESYSDFRKGLRWSESDRRWYEIETRSGWTFENQFRLTERSTQCLSGQIINYEWLSDWQNADPWLRVRNRFFTFALFAMYRSSLNDNEDWQLRHDFDVDFVTPIEHHRFERSISNFNPGHSSIVSSNSLETWFSHQDWYLTNEWDQG